MCICSTAKKEAARMQTVSTHRHYTEERICPAASQSGNDAAVNEGAVQAQNKVLRLARPWTLAACLCSPFVHLSPML
jgi:hypothetical protein